MKRWINDPQYIGRFKNKMQLLKNKMTNSKYKINKYEKFYIFLIKINIYLIKFCKYELLIIYKLLIYKNLYKIKV